MAEKKADALAAGMLWGGGGGSEVRMSRDTGIGCRILTSRCAGAMDPLMNKEPWVLMLDSVQTISDSLGIANGVIATLKVRPEQMEAALDKTMLATDVAEWLVRKGCPFREAHHISGRVVVLSEKPDISMDKLTLEQLQAIDSRFTADMVEAFEYESSVEAKSSGGAPFLGRQTHCHSRAKSRSERADRLGRQAPDVPHQPPVRRRVPDDLAVLLFPLGQRRHRHLVPAGAALPRLEVRPLLEEGLAARAARVVPDAPLQHDPDLGQGRRRRRRYGRRLDGGGGGDVALVPQEHLGGPLVDEVLELALVVGMAVLAELDGEEPEAGEGGYDVWDGVLYVEQGRQLEGWETRSAGLRVGKKERGGVANLVREPQSEVQLLQARPEGRDVLGPLHQVDVAPLRPEAEPPPLLLLQDRGRLLEHSRRRQPHGQLGQPAAAAAAAARARARRVDVLDEGEGVLAQARDGQGLEVHGGAQVARGAGAGLGLLAEVVVQGEAAQAGRVRQRREVDAGEVVDGELAQAQRRLVGAVDSARGGGGGGGGAALGDEAHDPGPEEPDVLDVGGLAARQVEHRVEGLGRAVDAQRPQAAARGQDDGRGGLGVHARGPHEGQAAQAGEPEVLQQAARPLRRPVHEDLARELDDGEGRQRAGGAEPLQHGRPRLSVPCG
ncbi:uncharacterized protein E0L32_003652 [Thyridium curvatum]|uniref:Argininosuccinate lyase C-terminal domain-containing protein n=1 Tax=Thyridium curvatum TaxID=1093900 RepID=A0A507BIA3_9PEZI|nr:uncharacterized protein E0L32_003652 [Thyridium curvatum]TPX16711.1 hypothetical protein E0L32_003652 [Thyridium curvatum]